MTTWGPPTSFTSGETVSFTVAPADYPAGAGWTVTWRLAGASVASAVATEVGGAYLVTLTASASDALAAGTYQWALEATKGAERYVFQRGTVAVQPDLEEAIAGSLTDPDEVELAAVTAAIQLRLTRDVAEYGTGDGTTAKKEDLAELYRIRNRLRARIAARRAGGRVREANVYFGVTGA